MAGTRTSRRQFLKAASAVALLPMPAIAQGAGPKVVVIGGGMAGDNAAAVAWGMGAHVTVFDLNVNILRKIDAEYGGAIETRYSSQLGLEDAVKQADLVIGAVLVPGAKALIVIGYDRRFLSGKFARSIAEIFAGNGFKVLLTPDPTPTPAISFAVKQHGAVGGVMITASHNPPQYNGFKISKRRAKPVGEATGLAEIRKRAAMVDPVTLAPQNGRVEQRDLWPDYKRHVRSFLDLGGKKVKVEVAIVHKGVIYDRVVSTFKIV